MFCSKLLIAATMIRALQAQENGPEYVNIVAGENPLTFVHPELPAGINDGICSRRFSLYLCFISRLSSRKLVLLISFSQIISA